MSHEGNKKATQQTSFVRLDFFLTPQASDMILTHV